MVTPSFPLLRCDDGQDRVTDHRVGFSLKNLDSVLEGDALQEIIDVLSRKHQEDLLAEAMVS